MILANPHLEADPKTIWPKSLWRGHLASSRKVAQALSLQLVGSEEELRLRG